MTNPSPHSPPAAGPTPPEPAETRCADLRFLESGRTFYGFLTLENLDAVADRIRELIGNGRCYTWVACNEGMREYAPEVRTSQVAEKIEADRREDEHGTYGSIIVVDTYGVWSIHTDAPDQQTARRREAGYELAYLHITHDKVEITHKAPAGYRLYWVAAVERRS